MTQAKSVDIPEDVLDLLARSRLSALEPNVQVRTALALHLFVTGEVSLGKAAELSGLMRHEFEQVLHELNIAPYVYGMAEYEQDKAAIELTKRRIKPG
jgi:predicted HTH domain antitoxin